MYLLYIAQVDVSFSPSPSLSLPLSQKINVKKSLKRKKEIHILKVILANMETVFLKSPNICALNSKAI